MGLVGGHDMSNSREVYMAIPRWCRNERMQLQMFECIMRSMNPIDAFMLVKAIQWHGAEIRLERERERENKELSLMH